MCIACPRAGHVRSAVMSRGKVFTASELAAKAGLLVVRASRGGLLNLGGDLVMVGPHASEDALATLACRAFVRRRGTFSESRVARVVAHHGFSYEIHHAAAAE
jgi:hypothetical protein